MSAKTVTEHVFSSITEVDGKFISSFWLLIRKPGQLTKDYMTGVRVKRLSPFQMLLLVNIAFYLMAAYMGSSAFTTKLNFHTNAPNFIHQAVAKKMVNDTINASGESREAYAKRFNDMVEVQAKSLVMLMVPMLALVTLLLYSGQNHPVVGSLVFATHLFTFMLWVQTFVIPLVLKLESWLVRTSSLSISGNLLELIYSGILFGLIGTYFYLSAKRCFQQNTVVNLIKTIFFIFAMYWVYLIYRMVLFFTTFYAI